MRIFLVLGAKSDTPKMCKQMDVFAFSHKAQNFLKARCARLGPWHLLPPPAELSCAPPAVHVKAVADSALRCTGLSLGCVYGSSAASTSAVQLEQPQASTRARAERGASAFAKDSLRDATHSVEFFLLQYPLFCPISYLFL